MDSAPQLLTDLENSQGQPRGSQGLVLREDENEKENEREASEQKKQERREKHSRKGEGKKQ